MRSSIGGYIEKMLRIFNPIISEQSLNGKDVWDTLKGLKMEKAIIDRLQKTFQEYAHEKESIEF